MNMTKNRSASHVRPEFQRVFINWLMSKRDELSQKVRIWRRSDKVIILAFAGLNFREIYASIRSTGIMVIVEQNGRFHDAIFDLDVDIVRTPSGYCCSLCKTDSREIYRSRADLWCDHSFKPFLEWMNEKLFKAKAMRVASAGGVSWATLLISVDKPIAQDPELTLAYKLKPVDGEKPLRSEIIVEEKLIHFV